MRIAIYGKGGIGKSVVATNLSVLNAKQGRRVLHVGCDPKHDSAVRLVDPGVEIRTVLKVLGENPEVTSGEGIINQGRHGIHCCEAGGPKPGLGCGGRGVARTLEFMEELDILDTGDYQVVIFDVLGDVVCGGFAAPLRKGFAERVVIVASEEPMALYAANNIARAVTAYQANGVVLAGLVANLKGPEADRKMLAAFADELSTRVLTFVPRDPAILAAERKRLTAVEASPGSPASLALVELAGALDDFEPDAVGPPTPMEDDAFYEFIGQW